MWQALGSTITNKILLYSIGTQQTVYYKSIKLATCFGSSSNHQASSQTRLKLHSVDVHIVGSQLFTNRATIKGTNNCHDCHLICKQLGSHNMHIY